MRVIQQKNPAQDDSDSKDTLKVARHFQLYLKWKRAQVGGAGRWSQSTKCDR